MCGRCQQSHIFLYGFYMIEYSPKNRYSTRQSKLCEFIILSKEFAIKILIMNIKMAIMFLMAFTWVDVLRSRGGRLSNRLTDGDAMLKAGTP